MTLDIRFTEIVDEIKEDLELQSGLVLSETQSGLLKLNKHIVFKKSDIEPYIKDITEYLKNTSPSERVWECYQVISNDMYIIAINIENPYIRLNVVDLYN